jgi:hypothetical protein
MLYVVSIIQEYYYGDGIVDDDENDKGVASFQQQNKDENEAGSALQSVAHKLSLSDSSSRKSGGGGDDLRTLSRAPSEEDELSLHDIAAAAPRFSDHSLITIYIVYAQSNYYLIKHLSLSLLCCSRTFFTSRSFFWHTLTQDLCPPHAHFALSKILSRRLSSNDLISDIAISKLKEVSASSDGDETFFLYLAFQVK